nr:unnamed protein product [Callosobruchus analis]
MVLTRETCEEIKLLVNNILTNSLKDPIFIARIADQVAEATAKTVSKKLEAMENNLSQLEKSTAEFRRQTEAGLNKLHNDIKFLHEKQNKMQKIYNDLDQQSRKNNLRLFNFAEDEKENTREKVVNFLNLKMTIDIKDSDIEICYRVGKVKGDKKPRGIYLKLRDGAVRNTIYNKKKFLKGTGVVVVEDLTPARVKTVSLVSGKVLLKNVWTNSGKIYVSINGKIHLIHCEDDVARLFQA